MLEPLRVDKPGQNNQSFNPSGLFEFAKKASELFFGLKKYRISAGNVFSAGQPEGDVIAKKPFFKDKQRRRLVLAYFSGGELKGKRPGGGYSSPEQEPFRVSVPKRRARYHIRRNENSEKKGGSQELDGHCRQFFNPFYPFIGCGFFVVAYGFYHLASPGSTRNIFCMPSLTETDGKLFLYMAVFYVLAGVHVFLSAWERLWGALVASGVYPVTACAVLLGMALAYALTDPLYLIPFWTGVFLFAAYVFNSLFFIFMP